MELPSIFINNGWEHGQSNCHTGMILGHPWDRNFSSTSANISVLWWTLASFSLWTQWKRWSKVSALHYPFTHYILGSKRWLTMSDWNCRLISWEGCSSVPHQHQNHPDSQADLLGSEPPRPAPLHALPLLILLFVIFSSFRDSLTSLLQSQGWGGGSFLSIVRMLGLLTASLLTYLPVIIRAVALSM